MPSGVRERVWTLRRLVSILFLSASAFTRKFTEFFWAGKYCTGELEDALATIKAASLSLFVSFAHEL